MRRHSLSIVELFAIFQISWNLSCPVSKPLGALENAASRTRTRLSGHRASGRPAYPVGGSPSPHRPLAYRVQDGRPAELPRRGSIRIVGVAGRSLFLRSSA